MDQKILFLFSNFHQRDFTGQAGTAWQLVNSVSAHYPSMIVSDADNPRTQSLNNIELALFPSNRNQIFQYAWRFPSLLKKIKKGKPFLIHVHGLPLIIYAQFLSWFSGTPYFCSFNEDITLRPGWMKKAIAKSINRSQGIVVSCTYFKNELISLGVDPGKISVSTFGLKPSFLKPKTVIRETTYDVAYIGDARKSRGFDVVRRLADENPDMKFLILIRWISSTGKKDYDHLRAKKNATLLEYPYDQSIEELMGSAKLVFLPFRSTSAILPPMTVAESMALGKCVITTNLPGMDQLCEEGKDAFFVNPDDIHQISHLVRDLLDNNEKRAGVGSQARLKMEKLFNSQYIPFLDAYAKIH